MASFRIVALRWIVWAFVALGGCSAGYCLYDLARPNHFVGDMYGLEVLMRLAFLAVPLGVLLLAGMIFAFASRKPGKPSRIAASALVVVAALILALMAGRVASSRRQDDIRNRYPNQTTAELLRIARDQKDCHAIDELLIRKDPAAVPGLRTILLDANEHLALRVCAAHALGEIGGPQAKTALEQARATHPHDALRTAIDYALQIRMAEDEPNP